VLQGFAALLQRQQFTLADVGRGDLGFERGEFRIQPGVAFCFRLLQQLGIEGQCGQLRLQLCQLIGDFRVPLPVLFDAGGQGDVLVAQRLEFFVVTFELQLGLFDFALVALV